MSHVYRRVPVSAKADHDAAQHPQYQVSGNFALALLLGGKGLPRGASAPDPLRPPAPATGHQATLTGSGAIAQGTGAIAVGQDGVFVGGGNSGNINTGTQISGDFVRGDKVMGNKIGSQINTGGGAYVAGNVSAGRDFVGRDRVSVHGASPGELAPLFGPLLAAVARLASAERKVEAVQQVQQLRAEAEKGKQADDGEIARIVQGLADMAPGAVKSLVSMFATPILGGVIGPVTRHVLEKLKEN